MEPRGFPARHRLRLLKNRNMLIGLNQLPDKLVFENTCCHCEPVRTLARNDSKNSTNNNL